MKSSVVFTNTLSISLMNWLKEHAKTNNTTKKAIIEEALIRYKNEVTKRELKKSFIRASNDMDIINMSEEGMTDYNEQLKSMNI